MKATWQGKSAFLGLVGGLALLVAAGTANAGIANTRHNLGTGGPAGNNQFSGTAEICVFCHTPHGAATGAGNPPLWNKTLPSGPYTVYSSTTLDASRATDGVGTTGIGSVSIACLSCHDGSQAMNSVINAPGSGLTNPTFTAGVWTAGNGPTPVDTATGKMGAGIANLGTDLSNDHPIGIEYCGGGLSGKTSNTGCADPDFYGGTSAATNKLVFDSTKTVWWVDTEATGNGTRQKTDMILYTRSFTGGTGPSVECASCHDPHVENVANSNPTFLRISNAQSAVCLACHVK